MYSPSRSALRKLRPMIRFAMPTERHYWNGFTDFTFQLDGKVSRFFSFGVYRYLYRFPLPHQIYAIT